MRYARACIDVCVLRSTLEYTLEYNSSNGVTYRELQSDGYASGSKRSDVDSLLTYAHMAYFKEGILLLRGYTTSPETVISKVMIPPCAVHGFDFANFPWRVLPNQSLNPWDAPFASIGHSPSLRAGLKSLLRSHPNHNGLPLSISS